MPTYHIPYAETGYFSSIICDYLDRKSSLSAFYNNVPSLESFSDQIKSKANFKSAHRKVLADTLKKQYATLETTGETTRNINLLQKENTFTITTGHQLNLFTGPLYFLYKIIHTIKLSQRLNEEHQDYNFIPIYWMATEDHDFNEINYFNINGKKVRWNREDINDNDAGAVGALRTDGLDALFEQFCAELGKTTMACELCDLFEASYLQHDNLAAATRYLANALFADYGLVILDADDPDLKRLFAPVMERELLEKISYKNVTKSAEKLNEMGYDIQVSPREINLFYLKDKLRERIIERDGNYFIHDTQIKFSQAELLEELRQHPERFSPNVIMRPAYQETILPNLCYIGGGGELAYWLELKAYFDEISLSFPILMLRNSALLMTEKQLRKAEKMGVSIGELFRDNNDLVNRRIRKISNIDIDFTPQKDHLVRQFEEMYRLAEKTDPTFLGAVKAQEVKQIKGLEHLEKRLLKAQKRKLSDEVNRLNKLQLRLFPQENLQERITNFSEFYLHYGDALIPELMDALDPKNPHFTVVIFE